MDKIQELFNEELKVINIGLERFYEALLEQETASVQVDWRPPAGGKEELQRILDALNK